ncbi:hypothetical protein Bca52824_022445 [Brassica carinata]|uniref:Uncharacterized protein n=1 Tax=Brassica carinata TaxID=52824 RepID=A0A8X7VGR7_BRACI|nr:hypothetical protein Bca52824_022445 [Brassica carinata]
MGMEWEEHEAFADFKLKHTGPGFLSNGKRRPRHQRFTVFHHNSNKKLVSTESAAIVKHNVVFRKVVTGMDVVYKIKAEGNQSGIPNS